MIIKERTIINRILRSDNDRNSLIKYLAGEHPTSTEVLVEALDELENLRSKHIEWGLPELIMPSFREVMDKSMKSFNKIDYQLIHEFGEACICGILLFDQSDTVVYRFENDKVKFWYFTEKNKISTLCFYFEIEAFDDNSRECVFAECLLNDKQIFSTSREDSIFILQNIATEIVLYNAVKKYVQVEIVEIPLGKFTDIHGTPLEFVEKKKVINNTGQKVVVLDSKWFRKIINNNVIFVRGFFRLQRKKNSIGEWYKELIFVESYVRNGYHRDALIEKYKKSNEL